MNKLRIFAGGFPIKNDDIDLIQDSMFDGVKGIVSAFAKQHNGYIILGGIDINLVNQSSQVDTYDVTEGYLVYNYELFFCPAQTVDVRHNYTLEAAIDYTYPSEGVRQFLNGNTYDTHEVRKVVIREATQTGYDLPMPRIEDSIDLLLKKAIKLEVVNSVLSAGWLRNAPIEMNISGATKQLYINLKTSSTLISSATGSREIVFNLPIEFRPQKAIFYNLVVDYISTFSIINVVIQINGDVSVIKLTNVIPLDFEATIIYI